eukprot:496073-Pyramimonas_sp.AAC.1
MDVLPWPACPTGSVFPGACVQGIRSAACSSSVHTSQSLDGFHPRHAGHLSDEGITVLALLFEAYDRLG